VDTMTNERRVECSILTGRGWSQLQGAAAMPGECLHGDRGLGVREAWSDLVAEQRDRSESEARGTGSPGDASQTILRPDSVMKVSRAVWAGWRVTFRAVHPRRARAGGQTPCSIGHASRKRSGAYRLQTGEQWRRTANALITERWAACWSRSAH
jgi:hypothetical protein